MGQNFNRLAGLLLLALCPTIFSAGVIAVPPRSEPVIEATEAGAPTSTDARLQQLENMLAKLSAAKPAAAVSLGKSDITTDIKNSQGAAIPPGETPPAKSSTLSDIVNSPVFVIVVIGALIFGIRILNQRDETARAANADAKQLDADRWVGLVHHLYNAAQDAGFLDKWSGKDKLSHALNDFDSGYIKTFGYAPGERDRTDLVNDLAVLAHHDEHESTAQPLTAAVLTTTSTPAAA